MCHTRLKTAEGVLLSFLGNNVEPTFSEIFNFTHYVFKIAILEIFHLYENVCPTSLTT